RPNWRQSKLCLSRRADLAKRGARHMPKSRTPPLFRANHIPELFNKLSAALIRYLDASNREGPERLVARRLALARVDSQVAAELLERIADDFDRLEKLGPKASLTKKEKRQLDSALEKLDRFFED